MRRLLFGRGRDTGPTPTPEGARCRAGGRRQDQHSGCPWHARRGRRPRRACRTSNPAAPVRSGGRRANRPLLHALDQGDIETAVRILEEYDL